jgi:peptidylprolyl isomerase
MIRMSHCFRNALMSLGIALGMLCLSGLPMMPGTVAQAQPLATNVTVAYLPPGNAITDGRSLLRYSLPIDNDEIRQVQETLEGISEGLRAKRWGPVTKDIKKVDRLLSRKRDRILASVPEERRTEAESSLDALQAGLEQLQAAADNQDKDAVRQQRRLSLEKVTQIEKLMVTGFPFEVPAEYSSLPQLKGRATVEFQTNRGSMLAVVDGYSAPVTAGNFVDLVRRGFYNGLEFIRAEDNYVLQTGDPPGDDEGFIDPTTGEYRAIPLEILVKGESTPVYGNTLEALGRYLDEPVLPFSAFGTLGMARPNSEPNGGSSQFFFFLFEPELTPAGLNLLDGRYSVFGYVVENQELLEKLGQGDRIEKARVVSGLDNLVLPNPV